MPSNPSNEAEASAEHRRQDALRRLTGYRQQTTSSASTTAVRSLQDPVVMAKSPKTIVIGEPVGLSTDFLSLRELTATPLSVDTVSTSPTFCQSLREAVAVSTSLIAAPSSRDLTSTSLGEEATMSTSPTAPSSSQDTIDMSSSSPTSSSPTPPAVCPKGLVFEPIISTILRHLHCARDGVFDPRPSHHSETAIFQSLKRELWAALTQLRLDMCCSTCGDVLAEKSRHVDDQLRNALRKLVKDIERLNIKDWMNEGNLRKIGGNFIAIKSTYRMKFSAPGRPYCVAWGGFATEMPRKPVLSLEMLLDVDIDLPPFSKEGGYLRGQLDEMRQKMAEQMDE